MASGAISLGFSVWFWRQIATWASIFKRDEVAIEYWARIHAARPNDSRTLATLAHLHAGRGRQQEAISLLERAVALDPSGAALWFNLGFLRQTESDHSGVLEAFERAIALDDKLDRAYYGKGLSLIKLGQLEEAIEPLRRNTRLQPMSPYGYYQLVHLYHRLGRTALAEETIRHLSGFEPQVARQLERETGIKTGLGVR